MRFRIIATALILSANAAWGIDLGYWAWQRDEPLTEQESAELAAQKIETIYWQIGELENSGETWRWKARFRFPSSGQIHLEPAVRLVSRERQPFSNASVTALVAALSSAIAKHEELQLDYDAPDRLLSDYAAALEKIRALFPHLTITALPHWSRRDCLKVLGPHVEELLPMLYDFEAEPVLKDPSPMPLIAPEKISKLIEDWRSCGKTWRAGLPVFARLSVYDANQKLRGQIRNWTWDELCFNRNLTLENGGQFGATILRATGSTSISNTPIRPNEKVIVRLTDRAALRDAIRAAESAGAKSVVLFRLPDSSASSGWSLSQLGHLGEAPRLILRKTSNSTLELVNEGNGDLPPRFASEQSDSGGYTLELEAGSRIFREAQPGDFASVSGQAAQKPVSLPFATTLRFKFSELRARARLETGLIQLAPGAHFSQSRYRILNIEGGPPWKSLE
ncbi:MAG TPA: hypothetical protein VIU85_02695 [Chthoniobacterales bacterium]